MRVILSFCLENPHQLCQFDKLIVGSLRKPFMWGIGIRFVITLQVKGEVDYEYK